MDFITQKPRVTPDIVFYPRTEMHENCKVDFRDTVLQSVGVICSTAIQQDQKVGANLLALASMSQNAIDIT